MAPSEAESLVLALRMGAGADAFYDSQVGLVGRRMAADPGGRTLACAYQAVGGGHATPVRASRHGARPLPVSSRSLRALAALAARLKAESDPEQILIRAAWTLGDGPLVHPPRSRRNRRRTMNDTPAPPRRARPTVGSSPARADAQVVDILYLAGLVIGISGLVGLGHRRRQPRQGRRLRRDDLHLAHTHLLDRPAGCADLGVLMLWRSASC